MTQGKLEGLVALVTGASTGIGKASAISFSKEGAKVRLHVEFIYVELGAAVCIAVSCVDC